MQDESARTAELTLLEPRRQPARFRHHQEPKLQSEPVLSLLPDMSNANGRDVVEIIGRTLRQYS